MNTAIGALRIVVALTILLGLTGMVGGLVSAQMLQVFNGSIPAWLAGAAVAFIGVRYWFRLKNLEARRRMLC